jgi:hypothetical protein
MECIKDTVITLVTELEDHEDETSKPSSEPQSLANLGKKVAAKEEGAWLELEQSDQKRRLKAIGKSGVRCVAGRTPLDEAPAAMLAQLLRKEGLAAEVAIRDAVSRRGIDLFEQAARESVATICICYIDANGSTSALRFLVRRLRRRLPDVHLIIAVWPNDHPELSDIRLKQSVGEAEYVSSLRLAFTAAQSPSKASAATTS